MDAHDKDEQGNLLFPEAFCGVAIRIPELDADGPARCPFCKSNFLYAELVDHAPPSDLWSVACGPASTGCGFVGPFAATEAQAIEAFLCGVRLIRGESR